jgi:hypothetical protein
MGGGHGRSGSSMGAHGELAGEGKEGEGGGAGGPPGGGGARLGGAMGVAARGGEGHGR